MLKMTLSHISQYVDRRIRSQVSRLVVGKTLTLGILFLTGCQVASHRSARVPEGPRDRDANEIATKSVSATEGTTTTLPARMVRDVGIISAGETVNELFAITNHDDCMWSLDGDRAIESSCGCTKVDVANHLLRPGESTAAKVTIRTDGKVGHVVEQATLNWTSESGERHRCELVVKAQIQTLFAFDPPLLHFTKQDVRSGITKQVHLTLNDQVRIDAIQIESSADYLEVTKQHREASKPELVISVTCRATDNGEARRDRLTVFLPLADSASDAGTHVAVLPVLSEDPSALRTMPHMAMFRWDESARGWKTQLIVMGDPLEQGGSIARISADQLPVEFHTTRLSRQSQRLELTLAPPSSNEHSHEAAGERANHSAVRDKGAEHLTLPEQLTLWTSNGESHQIAVRYLSASLR
jgi:hypothetical protein